MRFGLVTFAVSSILSIAASNAASVSVGDGSFKFEGCVSFENVTNNIQPKESLKILEPVSYRDSVSLCGNASYSGSNMMEVLEKIAADAPGCLILSPETEGVRTLTFGPDLITTISQRDEKRVMFAEDGQTVLHAENETEVRRVRYCVMDESVLNGPEKALRKLIKR